MNALLPDISIWDDNQSTPQKVDFVKMKAKGADGVIIKTSQAAYADLDFIWNYAAAKQAGLLCMVYHFLVWDVDPIKQADFFCDLLKYDPPELGRYCDFEWWKVVPGNALAILDAFCTRVEARVQECGVYTAPGFWQPYGSLDEKWIKRPLWLAAWGMTNPPAIKPWTNWKYLQYTSNGDGLAYGCESKSVDLNYYNGTVDDLYKEAGKPQPPANGPIIPVTGKALFRVKITAASLRLRIGPGTKYPAVGILQAGDQVNVTEIAGDSCWFQGEDGNYFAGRYMGEEYAEII